MTDSTAVPTLSTWAGGEERIAALTARFYQRVPADPVIGQVFANMDPRHAAHVASFIAEVFGGGTPYTDHGGSHSGMIAHHLGRALTEAQRKRWI